MEESSKEKDVPEPVKERGRLRPIPVSLPGPWTGPTTNAEVNAFLDADEFERYEHAFHREFHSGCSRCLDRLERQQKESHE